MTYPLTGIKVLDMSRVLAGPFAGRMLCDLGADVVKLEPPEGDITRLWGHKIAGISGYYHQQNAGKRNISIDLSDGQGAELVKALVALFAASTPMVVRNRVRARSAKSRPRALLWPNAFSVGNPWTASRKSAPNAP